MSEQQLSAEQSWEVGYEAPRLRQLVAFAKLPFAKKLEWLEETQEMIDWLQRSASAARAANAENTDPS